MARPARKTTESRTPHAARRATAPTKPASRGAHAASKRAPPKALTDDAPDEVEEREGDDVADAAGSARRAGLRYVNDQGPGLRRKRAGKHFRYLDGAGAPVRDEATIARARHLAIPPAWSDVWICPQADGHIQATGRDARGRKQYRYHARWREVRDETKYHRVLDFGRALPTLRQRLEADLVLPGLPRDKVLAAVVRLLEITLIRVGNDEYAAKNDSYGLTTMRDEHAEVRGAHVRFRFRGKSGVVHDVDFDDRRLAKIVKQCRDLPGQELFQFMEDGRVHDVGSADVNEYLRDRCGHAFTAKDFRTWAGTVLAAQALQEIEGFDSQAQAKKNIVRAIESVAKRLGNTKAVCRKCYVHPSVLDAYLDGTLLHTLKQKVEKEIIDVLPALHPEEAAVLAFLQGRLARDIHDVDAKGAGAKRPRAASKEPAAPKASTKRGPRKAAPREPARRQAAPRKAAAREPTAKRR